MTSLRTVISSKAAIGGIALALGLALGGAVAWQYGPSPAAPAPSEHGADTTATTGDAPSRASDSARSGLAAYDENGDGVVYQGGMHPDVVQDEPGQCPICGMDLTPVQVGGGGSGGTIRISPATLQNIGVETTAVSVAPLSRRVRTTARFEANERRMTAVAPKVSGWVETLYADYEGARVRQGEPLFAIYSPELVATQEEYLTALRNARRLGDGDPGSERLVEAARRRLQYWDISDAQIERLKETGTPERTLTFEAPASGTITRKQVTEGEKITAGQTLMHITNLDPLWLMVDLYEQDLAWVEVGTEARIELPYAPGRAVTGRVDYIYDAVDPDTRTVKARITVPNPDRALKPGMYATVTLTGGRAAPTPLVPEEAVVSSGEREVVIQALGDGRFRPVVVETGLAAGGQVQILEGLSGGESVVTSAQFLIDSEARLSGALRAMTAGTHQHESTSTPTEDMDEEMDHSTMDHSTMNHSTMDHATPDPTHSGAEDGPTARHQHTPSQDTTHTH
jgi:RND family efflux transporter MFP subunit